MKRRRLTFDNLVAVIGAPEGRDLVAPRRDDQVKVVKYVDRVLLLVHRKDDLTDPAAPHFFALVLAVAARHLQHRVQRVVPELARHDRARALVLVNYVVVSLHCYRFVALTPFLKVKSGG